MKKTLLTAIFILVSLFLSAQEERISNPGTEDQVPSVSELRSILNGAMMQNSFSGGLTQDTKGNITKTLTQIDKVNFETLSDTVKYYYYVLSAISKDELSLEEKEKLLDNAIFLRENIIGILDVEYVFCRISLAVVCMQQSNHSKCIKSLEKALIITQSLNLHSDFNFARRNLLFSFSSLCYWGLAGSYETQENYTPAMACYFIVFSTQSSVTGSFDNDISLTALKCSFEMMLKIKNNNEYKTYYPELVLEHIRQNNGTRTRAYAITQGYKALSDGASQQSIDLLMQSISFLKSINDSDEYLASIYKTLCRFYSQLNMQDELDRVIPQVKDYFEKTGYVADYEELINELNK